MRRAGPGMRALLAAGLLLLVAAPAAHAHGGQFVPPPPTPGGARPALKPRANTPTHVDPGTGGPVVTPGGGLLKPGLVGRREPPFTPTYELSWQLWWDLNRPAFLPRRPASLRRAVVTPGGPPPEDARKQWEEERERLVRERLIPFLKGLLDPAAKAPDDVRASAAIALGKIAIDATAIDVLWRWVVDEQAPDLVRESAALALGLLRRTPTARQLPAAALDPLRARLLQVFDGYVDGKRLERDTRTRQFAMLALGLLGDQPFSQDPQSKDGKLLTTLLWQRFTNVRYKTGDPRIAVLAAVGQQPVEGVSDEIVADLGRLAEGARVGAADFGPAVDAHGLSTLARLRGATRAGALRCLQEERGARNPPQRRVAAALALAEEAGSLSPAERLLAARMLERAMGADQEVLVMGLLAVSLGRCLGADLAEGSTRILESTPASELLIERAAKGPFYLRGFGVLALALAWRDAAGGDETVRRGRERAIVQLRGTLRDRTLEPDLRGAAAVGLGLLGDEEVVDDLVAIARNGENDADLRGHAALALGQVGLANEAVETTLVVVATGTAPEGVRAQAALGLSLLGRTESVAALLGQLRDGKGTAHLAGVTLALGHLGALEAVEPLIAVAGDADRPELVRAMALAALGVLTDPEETPSLLRLKKGAAYPLRTNAMEEAFTIL